MQTVLWQTGREEVLRFARSVAASCAHALEVGAISAAELAFGDCSPDPVASCAEDLVPPADRGTFRALSYVHFTENLGSAGGQNALFESNEADAVMVVNPDTYASPHLVAELVSALSQDGVGIVEARQLPLEHPKAHDPETMEVSWASGACLCIRKEVVAATGGFDTGLFFLHGDDVDLSWRTKLAGWRVVQRPQARVFHDKRLTREGGITPGEREVEQSAIVGVLLPWRYSRSDLARARLERLAAAGDAVSQHAAAVLQSRIEEGTMPEPIDEEHGVAQFVGEDFAPHRFSYADP